MLFRMQENVSLRVQNSKFSGGACPRTPLAGKPFQAFQNVTRLLLETTYLYHNLIKPLYTNNKYYRKTRMLLSFSYIYVSVIKVGVQRQHKKLLFFYNFHRGQFNLKRNFQLRWIVMFNDKYLTITTGSDFSAK